MPNIEELDLSNPQNVKFNDLKLYCIHWFGSPKRGRGKGDHFYFPVPWPLDPIVNIQPDERNKKMAKPYQVRQVIQAVAKIKEMGE